MRTLKDVFGDDEKLLNEVLKDLSTDHISDNVKYWAFNNVLDFQPVALSEVPEAYLRAGNARILYALKTWSLKVLDVYRQEVFAQFKEDKVGALTNMFRLTAYLGLMGATADTIKDFVTGREVKAEDMPDNFVEALAKTFFFNRYIRTQAETDGLGSAILGQFLPPTQALDNAWRDLHNLFSDTDESIRINDLRTVRDIPVGGELYYWWFGKGADIKQRDDEGGETGGTTKIKIPIDRDWETDYVSPSKRYLALG